MEVAVRALNAINSVAIFSCLLMVASVFCLVGSILILRIIHANLAVQYAKAESPSRLTGDDLEKAKDLLGTLDCLIDDKMDDLGKSLTPTSKFLQKLIDESN